jgi:tRNA(Ile)-lysidine synthase
MTVRAGKQSGGIMEGERFVRKVAAEIERHELARPGHHVLVAVSGGADSVALLATLHRLAPRLRLRLTVWHLDHGLRGDAGGRDLAFVVALAKRLGLTVRAERVIVAPGPNLEERARRIRHARMRRAADRAGCTRIALGHTQTDQAETLLLRLFRGAGRRGLAAMAPRRGVIVRPLLGCTREEVRAFLRASGHEWVEDATNRDERFTRNRLRRRIMPALVGEIGARLVGRLARTAAILGEEDRFLDGVAKRRREQARRTPDTLDAPTLGRLPAAIRRRVLRLWLGEVRGDLRGITAAHLHAVERCLGSPESRVLDLPRGRVRVEAGTVRWELPTRPPAGVAFTHALRPGDCVDRKDLGWVLGVGRPRAWRPGTSLPADTWQAVFDADRLPLPLVVRGVRPGDRIRPIGMTGTQKLQDMFVDARVPRSQRGTRPVLVGGEEVLWVPGIKRSAVAAVHGGTTRVVWVACRRCCQPSRDLPRDPAPGKSRRPKARAETRRGPQTWSQRRVERHRPTPRSQPRQTRRRPEPLWDRP